MDDADPRGIGERRKEPAEALHGPIRHSGFAVLLLELLHGGAAVAAGLIRGAVLIRHMSIFSDFPSPVKLHLFQDSISVSF
jgi:hypothetical protein